MTTLVVGNIKSNTSAPPVVQNNSGTTVGSFCRAWVSFNGHNVTGPATIRASMNVSSVGWTAEGVFVVNFTTAFSDTNYVVSGTIGTSQSGEGARIVSSGSTYRGYSVNKTTSSCRILTVYPPDGSLNDGGTDYTDIAFFGN